MDQTGTDTVTAIMIAKKLVEIEQFADEKNNRWINLI